MKMDAKIMQNLEKWIQTRKSKIEICPDGL
jgi:hypothetical protein